MRPLGEFRVPPESCPTVPSPPAAAGRLLSWAFAPYSTYKARRSTCRGRCHRPLRSALRVWLPSRRFTPSRPGPVLFHTGGAPGIRPAEPSPRERYPPRFRGGAPTCRSAPSVIPPPKRWAGPTGRGFWVLTLSRVPGVRRGLTRRNAGCSLGLLPLRAFRSTACASFRSPSSHALRVRSRKGHDRRRPGVSLGSRLAPPADRKRPGRAEQPFQGFRTGTIPHIRGSQRPGYEFTSCRVVHCCRPFDNLGTLASLYRSCPGIVLRCRTSATSTSRKKNTTRFGAGQTEVFPTGCAEALAHVSEEVSRYGADATKRCERATNLRRICN
jgi:hypothetical protein